MIDEIQYVYDTIVDGILVVDSNRQNGLGPRHHRYRDWGFKTFRKYDAGITANTALFFTKQFKKGWFRGFRHTMKPSMCMGFRPDYSESVTLLPHGRNRTQRPGRNDTTILQNF